MAPADNAHNDRAELPKKGHNCQEQDDVENANVPGDHDNDRKDHNDDVNAGDDDGVDEEPPCNIAIGLRLAAEVRASCDQSSIAAAVRAVGKTEQGA